MTDVAKLKKKAAEFEQKRQFDKALAVYRQLLDEMATEEESLDVGLYNRVGDLMLRQGDVAGAVVLYEKAVDLYSEGGFFNNAIALCNKILRTSPGRTTIYYKLGKISAKKGFASDAKQSFLEYADRMQRAGELDEAFRALKEFADLCPDQDDVRLMLAEQLSKQGRKSEAIAQLQTLYERFTSDGRALEASATVERMKAIDPTIEPKAEGGPRKEQKSDGLVFLDLSDNAPAAPPKRRTTKSVRVQPPPARRESGARELLPDTFAPANFPSDLPLLDLTPSGGSIEELPGLDLEPALGSTVDGLDITDDGAEGLLGLEPTSFADAGQPGTVQPPPAESIEIPLALTTEFEVADLPAIEDEAPAAAEHDLVLGGDLPMLDIPMPADEHAGGVGSGANDSFPEMSDTESFEMGMPELDQAANATSGTEAGAETSGALAGLPMLDFSTPPAAPVVPPPPPVPDTPETPFTVGQVLPAAGEAPRRRASTSVLAMSAEILEEEIRRQPGNHANRRRFGEALLERGDREQGLQELELAMTGYQTASDIESAMSVADEIIRLNPNSVRHHQKRVEYAFLLNDQRRLVEAYLELADGLFRSGQPDKARTVYQRVLELAPGDLRAQAALSAFIDVPAPAPSKPEREKSPSTGTRRQTVEPATRPVGRTTPAARRSEATAEFVNLGDWLREDDAPKSTRMVVPEQAPSGDEAADFADMLKKFKRGVAENVDEEDHQSHYDLGVAFKEMGLLDEAIAEFQKALRGANDRIRTYEALGQCFVEKSQHHIALTLLQRALVDGRPNDEQLVGVLYLLGYCAEAMKRYPEAVEYYQRVFGVDIEFRDVAERITALEKATR